MPYIWQSVEEAAVTLGISTRTLHRRITKREVETRLADGRREVLVCLPDEEAETEPQPVEIAQTRASEPEQPQPPVQSPPVQAQATRKVPEPPVDPQPNPVFDPPPFHGDGNSGHGQQAGMADDVRTAIVMAHQEVALANERVRRTDLALVAFQHTSQLLEREATRSRISARVAWGVVALLSVGVYIAVGWTASKVTRANADNEHLSTQLQAVSVTIDQQEKRVGQLRAELAQCQQNAAKAEGELAATKASLHKTQTEADLLAAEASLQAVKRAELARKKSAETQPSSIIDRLTRLWID